MAITFLFGEQHNAPPYVASVNTVTQKKEVVADKTDSRRSVG